MSILSDKWIKQAVKAKGMIKPFVGKQVRKGKISFGLSSYGYDARVSNEFKIFTNVNSGIVDPKVFKKESFVTKIGNIKARAGPVFTRVHCHTYRLCAAQSVDWRVVEARKVRHLGAPFWNVRPVNTKVLSAHTQTDVTICVY